MSSAVIKLVNGAYVLTIKKKGWLVDEIDVTVHSTVMEALGSLAEKRTTTCVFSEGDDGAVPILEWVRKRVSEEKKVR